MVYKIEVVERDVRIAIDENKTIEQVCEMLYHIDELLEDRAKSAAELHGDEMDDYSSIPT